MHFVGPAAATRPLRPPGVRLRVRRVDARERLVAVLALDCLPLAVDAAVLDSRQDDWRGNAMKIKRVRLAIKGALDQWGSDIADTRGEYLAGQENERLDALLELVKHQHEY